MTDELVFYHNPQSRSRIVHWMLEEVGAPYRTELVPFGPEGSQSPAYLAKNPMGKLPTLEHRGVVLTETAAILTYLADAFPQAGLAPAIDDPQRGTYLRWMFFGAGCVDAAIADRVLQRPVPERTSTLGYGTFEQTMAALEAAVSPGPFVLGERFTAVDVLLGSQIGWGAMVGAIQPSPRLAEYLGQMRTRPAIARTGEQDKQFLARLQASA